MSNEFNKCPNGHYYQGFTCPYCPKAGASATVNGAAPTIVGGNFDNETQLYGGGNMGNASAPPGGKTHVMGGYGDSSDAAVSGSGSNAHSQMSGNTVFGCAEKIETSAGEVKAEHLYRNTRKLVGWLATYSFDSMGIDFKLYEGRNIIGRDPDCSITVNDRMMSGRHAVLLYRAGRYSLTDSQSTHGTFVNDEDIALEPRYLNDGDVICMGETVFKFRTSL
jgi:hypothetical protein